MQNLHHQQNLGNNPSILNILPNSSHQMDLNHVWTQLQELSQLLVANRENAAQLVQRADEQARVDSDDGSLGLRIRTTTSDVEGEPDIQSQNHILRRENAALISENEDLSMLANDYECVLEKILEGLRIFIHEQSISTINIHQSYATQLAKERETNASLRQENTESQARLVKLGRLLRNAHEQISAIETDVLIDDLKSENTILREALGLT